MPVFNLKPTWSNFKVSNEGLILSLRKGWVSPLWYISIQLKHELYSSCEPPSNLLSLIPDTLLGGLEPVQDMLQAIFVQCIQNEFLCLIYN